MMTRRHLWIIAAVGMVFGLIFGVRQSVALFIGPLDSATELGIAAISLAFACAQLMWRYDLVGEQRDAGARDDHELDARSLTAFIRDSR